MSTTLMPCNGPMVAPRQADNFGRVIASGPSNGSGSPRARAPGVWAYAPRHQRGGGYAAGLDQCGAGVRRLLLRARVPFPGQFFELFILLIDAVRDALLVLFTRSAGRLFDQLPDVGLKDRDPIVEF